MKTKFALFFSLVTLTVWAQTNFDVLVCKNASYTNATIVGATPAYLLVSHDHGVAKVALTNLPDSLHKHYHYDPDKAAAAAAAEKVRQVKNAKANAARAQYLASLRGTNRVIRVIAVLDAFGQCQTSVGRVYMLGLPGSVGDYLNRYYQLKASIADNQVRAENMARAADRADANAATGASGDQAYVNAVMAQRYQANNMVRDANEAAEDLSKMKANMSEMELGLVQNTAIVAYSTGTQYSGFPMWQCVGVAP